MTDIMKERIKRLDEAIQRSGLSYGELAKITGIPKSTIQRYATGQTNKISIEKIEKLATATNTPTEHILCWDEKSTPILADRSAVINKINSLTDSQLDKLLGYLDGLTEE